PGTGAQVPVRQLHRGKGPVAALAQLDRRNAAAHGVPEDVVVRRPEFGALVTDRGVQQQSDLGTVAPGPRQGEVGDVDRHVRGRDPAGHRRAGPAAVAPLLLVVPAGGDGPLGRDGGGQVTGEPGEVQLRCPHAVTPSVAAAGTGGPDPTGSTESSRTVPAAPSNSHNAPY